MRECVYLARYVVCGSLVVRLRSTLLIVLCAMFVSLAFVAFIPWAFDVVVVVFIVTIIIITAAVLFAVCYAMLPLPIHFLFEEVFASFTANPTCKFTSSPCAALLFLVFACNLTARQNFINVIHFAASDKSIKIRTKFGRRKKAV